MRLIDADKLMEKLSKYIYDTTDPAARRAAHNTMALCQSLVDEQPTAYDVDKVVERLEECKEIMESPIQQDCYGEECNAGDCIVCAFEKAIKIAKTGGK